jgi:acyl-coenzyme A thioesterase PaaI-like protein
MLKAFGLKIPMILFVGARVVEASSDKCVVKIPLNRRTRNHLKAMYFGTLCVGADVAGGLIAMRTIQDEKASVSLVFKDMKAEFLKRAEGDVHFTCNQGAALRELVHRAMKSGERENLPYDVIATVPSKLGDDPVARFKLTLSLKKRS